MADDRMKDDDLRNMGNKGEGQDFSQGQQTPGRNPQSGQQQGQGQQSGGQKHNMEDDDEFGTGSNQGFEGGKQTGTQNRGGQNR